MKIKRVFLKTTFLTILSLMLVALLASSVQADGPHPAGPEQTFPAPPPVVFRIHDDGSKTIEKVPVGAYYVPAPPPEIGLAAEPPPGDLSLITPNVSDGIGLLALAEGYYYHYAWYYIGDAHVKQTTYFYQDVNASQLIYWTKWEHLDGPGFGVVWFRLRNLRTNAVCCSWQINTRVGPGESKTQTINTYIDSQGSGTRIENFLSSVNSWWANYQVNLDIGL